MSKDPAVLFYTSDFLTGTSFFTDEQRGQYITLLCQQHQLWAIPEKHMLNICKSYDNPVLTKFVKDDDGKYYNVRMREESVKRANYCESRSKNKKTHKDNNNICSTYDKHMLVHMENENDNNINTTNTSNINTMLYRFDELWKRYPNKDGKKGALKHYKATVKTEEDWININKALDNYLQSKTVKEGFIKNGSTWFNNWQDWIDFTGVETEKDIKERKQRELDEAMRKARLNDLTNAK